jgi:hypothetical protein
MLLALPNNGRRLQIHYLVTGLYATIFMSDTIHPIGLSDKKAKTLPNHFLAGKGIYFS